MDVTRGADPAAEKKVARNATTITDLCDLYLKDAEAGRLLTRRGVAKRSSTLVSDRGRIAGHIKPLLGPMPVAAVTSQDVRRFMHAVAEGKTAARSKTHNKRGLSNLRGGEGVASRSVGLLGGIFTYAMLNGMRADNPVRGVIRFADGRKDRRLSDDEYRRLGQALAKARENSVWEPAVSAIEFLVLTGWRSGEAIGLLWREIDLDRQTVRLTETKSGGSLRALSAHACDVLRAAPNYGQLVFPPTRGEKLMTGFPKIWARVVTLGGLGSDITPHVLRHSFSSLASDLGYSESTIATLIGHRGHTVTSRYVHSADDVLLAAAQVIAGETRRRMSSILPPSPPSRP